MRPDLRRPGLFDTEQLAEVGRSRPPPAAQVLVFNEMNATASRCDVFECRDPIGKPVIEVGNLEIFDERGKSLLTSIASGGVGVALETVRNS